MFFENGTICFAVCIFKQDIQITEDEEFTVCIPLIDEKQ